MTNPTTPKGGWPGAGRPKGSKDKVSAAAKATMAELAKDYAPYAIRKIVRLAQKGKTQVIQLAACKEILDRAYGKPAQSMDMTVDLKAEIRMMSDEELKSKIVAKLASLKANTSN